jgi:hypothetical protein
MTVGSAHDVNDNNVDDNGMADPEDAEQLSIDVNDPWIATRG